jgi:hypothetical protein
MVPASIIAASPLAPPSEPVQIVDFYGQETAKIPIFGLCEPSVRWSLQGRILAFTTPKFQILNRL